MMESKIISEKTIYKGTTKKIEIKQFWDAHGRKIDEGTEIKKFDEPKEFEIVEVVRKYDWEWEPNELNWWLLKIDGETVPAGEIVGYNHLKTKLVLTSCVGAG